MQIERILVVEDDEENSQLLVQLLTEAGFVCKAAVSLASARLALASDGFDLVLSDIHLADGTGLDLLEEISKAKAPPSVVMMSGQATLETAIQAMRLGASDYLLKPISASQLEVALKRLETLKRLTAENAYLRQAEAVPSKMIGRSKAIQDVLRLIQQVAPTSATVLIEGESGTGKEVTARAIVAASPRAHAPFVAINCAALPENLIESELFGHERGAFTGALTKRAGRFELAEGGTLLLDEISEMPLHLQAKLLRVLQEHEVERVGGSRPFKVDVRVLAATNRDLKRLIQEGKFREDLFYRLNVVTIRLCPLRERREDIPLLIAEFLKSASKRHGKKHFVIPETAMTHLVAIRWPGNIRELQNAVERAVILSEDNRSLSLESFGIAPNTILEVSPDGESTDLSLEFVERRAIEAAMAKTGGNRTQACKILGISQPTLRAKLSAHLIAPL